MPPRRTPRAAMRSSNRVGSLFLVIGCLTVLGVTFAFGVAAGRRWPGGIPLPRLGGGSSAATPVERETPARPEGRGFDRERVKTAADAPPILTFYHELTAPLTSTPPAPRTVAGPRVAASAETREKTPPATATSATSERRFTVQVGVFKLRTQAEALRARLVDEDQDAYVTEVELEGITQYRVRVGAFATREAAREAAARLGAERQLATYVTTR